MWQQLWIWATAALMVGLFLLWYGRRGRRISDHDSCRKCGYDLFGQPDDSGRCPECGADLKHKRARRKGVWERSPRPRWVGGLCLAIGLAGFWLEARRGYQFIWQTPASQKPSWLLWANLHSHDQKVRDAAQDEMTNRWLGQRLSPTEGKNMADFLAKQSRDTDQVHLDRARHAMVRGYDRGLLDAAQINALTRSLLADWNRSGAVWHRDWSAFLESQIAAGRLSEQQWLAFQAAFAPTIRCEYRFGVPTELVCSNPAAPSSGAWTMAPHLRWARIVEISVNGKTWPEPKFPLTAESLRRWSLPMEIDRLPSGLHKISAVIEYAITFSPSQLEIRSRVERDVVVATGSPAIEVESLIIDPNAKPGMQAVELQLWVERWPAPQVYRVTISRSTFSGEMGLLRVPAGEPGEETLVRLAALFPDADHRFVTVRLKPSEQDAIAWGQGEHFTGEQVINRVEMKVGTVALPAGGPVSGAVHLAPPQRVRRPRGSLESR